MFFSRLADKAVKDYSTYRASLLFWALVDLIYNMFKVRTELRPALVCQDGNMHPRAGSLPRVWVAAALWPEGALLLSSKWLLWADREGPCCQP